MSFADKPLPHRERHYTAMELIIDHRERLALEEEERLTRRTRQFEELRAEFNSVSVRIRAWEAMHGLRLPTSPNHPVLDVIASVTGIPLAALQEEQQARQVKRVTPPPIAEVDVNDG